jgi:O-acetyl-ADP-ribose deacetylase (regulator of RNase III)
MVLTIVIADTRSVVVRHLEATLGTFASQFRADQVQVQISNSPVQDWDEEGVCYVNPGNAAGVMSGRLDTALSSLMPDLSQDVAAMTRAWGKRAPDGTPHLPLFAALLSRCNKRWCITSPAVFLPGPTGHYRDTRNAFHATHAALSLLISANRAGMGIDRVVMPGVCTAHGRMNRAEAARQMADAFRAVFIDNNIITDPTQAAHPRLLLAPHYEHIFPAEAAPG